MKNKKLVYLLGALVVIVWGLIVYRVIAAMTDTDNAVPPTAPVTVKEAYNDYSPPADTGKLSLNYRDPFNHELKKDTLPVTSRHIIKSPAAIPVPAMNWNFIKYSGFVRNPGSKKLVALVSINGKSIMLQEGETQDKVKLIKNMGDSIKVTFNGNTKFIKLDNGSL